MESKADPESETKVSGNLQDGTLDTSGFDVTVERLEELTKSMHVLLSDVDQLRSQCSQQATELMHAAKDLREQQEELKESYMDLSKEMQEIIDSMDELFNTKSAFETKEEEEQEPNQQL